jgi:P-type Ca2+ transporter type 2C
MWLAMKDKISVSVRPLTTAAVVSFALGFFQDFGTLREPVDWVEGVTIMVAILIAVCIPCYYDQFYRPIVLAGRRPLLK